MTEHTPVQQEPDAPPGPYLLRIASLALGVAAIGVFGSWVLRGDATRHSPARAVSTAAFAPEAPERTPIESSERGIALKAAQRKQLAHYGWVDRSAGIARVPIARAIELRAQGVR